MRTVCERCEDEGVEDTPTFTFHTDPARPERDHYICLTCNAYHRVFEVGHYDLITEEAIREMDESGV